MEIAIWTTILTTIITIIQTVIMWYFSQRVKLEDSEMDELVDKLDDDSNDVVVDTVSRTEVNLALNAVESEVADTLETMLAQIDFVNSNVKELNSLSESLIEAIDSIAERVEVLETTPPPPAPAMRSADTPTYRPYVEPPTSTPEIPTSRVKEVHHVAAGVTTTDIEEAVNVYDTKDVQMDDNTVEPEPNPVPEPEDPAEPLLKGPRGEDEPLITDLRATPFEEHPDAYENVHELPAFGDGYEAWGTSGGRGGRTPRHRGFRRL
jgi:hypothetical protein